MRGENSKYEYPQAMTKHECRMTKEARSPKWQRNAITITPHLIIRHSFELRHSDFVILHLVSNFGIRYSNFKV